MTVDTRLAAAFEAACRAELRAPKPGNVHDFAPGHRMTVRDFEVSAAAAAPFIAARGQPIGARVLGAMRATMDSVGCNTNLGILLLAAPLAAARERPGDLRQNLGAILAESTVEDAGAVFEAIRIANPGGLGRADTHDVAAEPTVTLTQAMAEAAHRDRIARQYITSFGDLFTVGAPVWQSFDRSADPLRRTLAVYFTFASTWPDTHVSRKHGPEVAEHVRRLFAEKLEIAAQYDLPALLDFDRELKLLGVNPGTSADLTVAVEFLVRVLEDK
ncbi:triphosphoribosyl-dephospho-CoA synthase [Mongoliimonas terrestris]|uniref:triphosphoribosyl-dephospho-CoA synthase n=1 Tax=Mongoliimonas terrestris TaxID=1709001 RepID=UPI0009495693|nr:triphosphoribosyl-dephospho-CoA synthase [Mongoliimonas terrestris]